MENGVETGGVAPNIGVCPVGTLEPGVLCAMMKLKLALEEFLLCFREGCDGGASDISLAGELSDQGLAPVAPDSLVFRLSRLRRPADSRDGTLSTSKVGCALRNHQQ